jgi:hypothetical protein
MASWCPLFNPYAMGCFIELDDGKIFTGNPYIIIFDGKNHGKNHGFPVNFPNKTNPWDV